MQYSVSSAILVKLLVVEVTSSWVTVVVVVAGATGVEIRAEARRLAIPIREEPLGLYNVVVPEAGITVIPPAVLSPDITWLL